MRVVAKNLPDKVTKEEVEKFFYEKGEITVVYLLTDPRSVFRRICFIGYKTQGGAEIAVKYYDNAIFKNHKIKVEFAKDNSESNENKPNETKHSGKSNIQRRS